MSPCVTPTLDRRRWLMISFAFLATLINYLDRQALSVAAPVVIDQFHMSSVTYWRVVSAFLLAYTISNGLSGPLIDRLGTHLGYALCIGWWSAASLLHALTRGPLSLRQAGQARPILLADAGREPSHTAPVREHGKADRCAGGGDRVAGGRWYSETGQLRTRGPEGCLWKAVKRREFAIFDFAGSAGAPSCGVENGSRKKNAARRNKGWRFGLH